MASARIVRAALAPNDVVALDGPNRARGSSRREPVLSGKWSGSPSSITQAEDGTVLLTDLQDGRLLSLSALPR